MRKNSLASFALFNIVTMVQMVSLSKLTTYETNNQKQYGGQSTVPLENKINPQRSVKSCFAQQHSLCAPNIKSHRKASHRGIDVCNIGSSHSSVFMFAPKSTRCKFSWPIAVRMVTSAPNGRGGSTPLSSTEKMLIEEEHQLTQLVSSDVRPARFRFNRAMALCARLAKESDSGGRQGRLALETGVRLLALMRRAGVSPNQHTYGALVDACAKQGAVAEAYTVLDMMRDDGVPPNVITCSALLAALAARAEAGDRSAPGQVRAAPQRVRRPTRRGLIQTEREMAGCQDGRRAH
jgi:pentatricopeptide repeat protein